MRRTKRIENAVGVLREFLKKGSYSTMDEDEKTELIRILDYVEDDLDYQKEKYEAVENILNKLKENNDE